VPAGYSLASASMLWSYALFGMVVSLAGWAILLVCEAGDVLIRVPIRIYQDAKMRRLPPLTGLEWTGGRLRGIGDLAVSLLPSFGYGFLN
jgi:hypothetical protein